jgi:hypothetical protein
MNEGTGRKMGDNIKRERERERELCKQNHNFYDCVTFEE